MADQQVALPMPWHGAIRHLLGPFVDANQVLDRPRRSPHFVRPTEPVPATQIAGEFPLQHPAGQHIEIGIDGFV